MNKSKTIVRDIRAEYLIGILSDNFIPRYCYEETNLNLDLEREDPPVMLVSSEVKITSPSQGNSGQGTAQASDSVFGARAVRQPQAAARRR